LADTDERNAGAEREQRSREQRFQPQGDLFGGAGIGGIGHNGGPVMEGTDPTNGFWSNPDWLFCRDGKWRPIESNAKPLANGLPRSMGTMRPELRELAEMAGLDKQSLAAAKAHRIGSLKGYGNAIISEVAVAFILAYMDYLNDRD
jgi:DNA (cytosine-5)-methyltransferase 1